MNLKREMRFKGCYNLIKTFRIREVIEARSGGIAAFLRWNDHIGRVRTIYWCRKRFEVLGEKLVKYWMRRLVR